MFTFCFIAISRYHLFVESSHRKTERVRDFVVSRSLGNISEEHLMKACVAIQAKWLNRLNYKGLGHMPTPAPECHEILITDCFVKMNFYEV